MSYEFSAQSFLSRELQENILKPHSIARNAITKGKYTVLGVGSTQLLSAAVFALSLNSSSPARVVAASPHYLGMQTEFFADEKCFRFYWESIPAQADGDIMIFTISKLTGHAGSRFGWALVKDEDVYLNMLKYMQLAELGVSRDTQLRALQLLKVVLEGDGREIFHFAYEKMRDLWEKISQIVSLSNRYTIQDIPPQYCNFFEKVRGPSPAYVWLKCEREEDTNCNAVLRGANIIGHLGSLFNASDRYVRLSLLKRDDDFNLLLYRLKELVSKEGGAETL
ncbi:Tryptophan aminotransferase-related protein 3 [Abeliophyllum distichum]|uniref:Tryptophan aminotransferase-related protein 3 n=1 Tax=Abeliophyllum distichum TaxID=126358 RepID=A0ABD1S8H8_9LAMI